MIEVLDPGKLNSSEIHKYIQQMENNKITIGKDVREYEVVEKLMHLSQVYTFFVDLHRYHKRMNLSPETLEKFILDIDDLIDAFEEYGQKKTNTNQLLNEYYAKAEAFYDLLINLQFELGFDLSDRKYRV